MQFVNLGVSVPCPCLIVVKFSSWIHRASLSSVTLHSASPFLYAPATPRYKSGSCNQNALFILPCHLSSSIHCFSNHLPKAHTLFLPFPCLTLFFLIVRVGSHLCLTLEKTFWNLAPNTILCLFFIFLIGLSFISFPIHYYLVTTVSYHAF